MANGWSALALGCCLFFGSIAPLYAQNPTQADRDKAVVLFEGAERAYDVGEYEKALAGYKEAYLLTGEPDLLFNLGQCQRQLKQWEDAKKNYEVFLRKTSEGNPAREQAQKLLLEINAELAKAPSKDPSSTPASAPITNSAIPASSGPVLHVDVPRPKQSFQVKVKSKEGTFDCGKMIHQLSSCTMQGVPAGAAEVLVTGSSSFSENVIIPTGSAALKIEHYGYTDEIIVGSSSLVVLAAVSSIIGSFVSPDAELREFPKRSIVFGGIGLGGVGYGLYRMNKRNFRHNLVTVSPLGETNTTR